MGDQIVKIRYADPGDRADLVRMRNELWPDSPDEHPAALDGFFAGSSSFIDQIVVCEDDGARLVGFAEVRVRNYAEGSEKMEVPYLEGWFVDSSCRRQGVGAQLIAGAGEWARSLGYDELASDTEIDNLASIAAHGAVGFEEVERSVCFLKKL